MSSHSTPEIVILPSEQLDDLAVTLESVARAIPDARIHVARPGVPALDAIADMVAGAGLQTIPVPSLEGFDAVLTALDRHFGTAAYCWVFAGEQLAPAHATALSTAGQLATPSQFPWLERPSPLSAPRVRAAGAPRVGTCDAVLPHWTPRGSWRICLLAGARAVFSSYDEMYEDVCLLVHLGELDAAFQRAELFWGAAMADGDAAVSLQLARAAVMLGLMQGVRASSVRACAHWFSLEPDPWVAMVYVRVAESSVPFAVIEGLLDLLPDFTHVSYRNGLVIEPVEAVLELRSTVAVARHRAKGHLDGVIRLLRAGLASPGEAAAALSLAFLLGVDPHTVVDAMPETMGSPIFASGVNVDLDVDHVAATLAALIAHTDGAAWVAQLAERFVLTRNMDAGHALDRAGVHCIPHWSRLASVAWLTHEMRAQARALAVAQDEMDLAEVSA